MLECQSPVVTKCVLDDAVADQIQLDLHLSGTTSEGLVRSGVVRWAIREQPDRDHLDDMPGVMWPVDNPGHLLMSRLSQILIESLSGSKSS